MAVVKDILIESLKRIEPTDNIEHSLALVLKSQAEEKQRHFRSLSNYYQTRYNISPEEFYKAKIEGKDHSWEDEETYFDWVTTIQMIGEMDKEIKKLEEIIAHADYRPTHS